MTNALMLDASWKWLPKTAIFVNVTQGYRDVPGGADAEGAVVSAARHRGSSRSADREDVGPARARLHQRASTRRARARAASGAAPSRICRSRCGRRCSAGSCSAIATRSRTPSSATSTTARRRTRRTCSRSPAGWRWICRGATSTRTTRVCSTRPTPARTDNFFQVGATLDYFVRNWIYAGIGYAVLVNRSDVTVIRRSRRTSTTRSSRCSFGSDITY